MAQAKLIGMTVGLTLLIWASADQLLRETEEVLVNIYPIAAGRADMSARPAVPQLGPFKVKVLGPRKTINRLRVGGVVDVRLPISERETGRHELDLKPLLRGLAGAFEGLSVEAVEPDVLEVLVDHEVTVSMPVRVDPGTLEYADRPSVSPGKVDVTLSELRLRELPEEKRHVALYVERILQDVDEGSLFDRDVRLEPNVNGTEVIAIKPAVVRLTARVEEHRRTIQVPAVPIRFVASPAVFNQYLVDRRDNLTVLTQSIRISGPADVIARVESGEIKLAGLIVLSWEDADRAGTFRHVTPTFHLPAQVRLLEEAASVEFRLIPADQGDGGAARPRGDG